MATKTKRSIKKSQEPTSNVAPERKKVVLSDLLPFVIICLYLLVEFIPDFKAADVMAPQWIYLGILNLLSLGYIIKYDELNRAGLNSIIRSAPAVIYTILFLLAGISVFAAINRIEALVVFSRFVICLIAFFNLGLLLSGRLNLFYGLSVIMAILVSVQSLGVLYHFFSGLGEKALNEIIYNLKGNSGNKNILAVSLAIKLPFVFYCCSRSRPEGGVLLSLVTALTCMAIFLINARASYLALIFQMVLYTGYQVYLFTKSRNLKSAIVPLAFILLPAIIAFAGTNRILEHAMSMESGEQSYGSVTERLASISLTEEGSNARLPEWKSALDYISSHPVMGAGYGNWKLASLPYERSYVDDLRVTYHVHNDLLETTAELGWAGGLLFLGIFASIAFLNIKKIFTSADAREKQIAVVLLALAATYFNDAMFNFPMERPVMQAFLVFLLAATVVLNKKNEAVLQQKKEWRLVAKPLYGVLTLVLLLPALVISWMTYKSMVAQYRYNPDMLSNNPKYAAWQVIRDLPSIPNLNAFCFPIDAIKARYLQKEKRYNEALALLNRSAGYAPAFSVNECFKANIFLESNNTDSGFYYASKAFNLRPRSSAGYRALLKAAYMKGDTATLNSAFQVIKTYRKEAFVWKDYFSYRSQMPRDTTWWKNTVDSAIRLYPGDQYLARVKTMPDNSVIQKANEFFTRGRKEFDQGAYAVALEDFLKASQLIPKEYSYLENVGLCYFALKQYTKAIPWFEKVVEMKTAGNGKSEFFAALSLYNTGERSEACRILLIAEEKKYSEVKIYKKQICGE